MITATKVTCDETNVGNRMWILIFRLVVYSSAFLFKTGCETFFKDSSEHEI